MEQFALDGFNSFTVTYGGSGSGKSYTMEGKPGQEGIMPRALKNLFISMENRNQKGWCFQIEASVVEIYNEIVRDIIQPFNPCPLEIKVLGNAARIANATVEEIKTLEELTNIIQKASKNRHISETDNNKTSSRSHMIVSIKITGLKNNLKSNGSLIMVDLAGTEHYLNPEKKNETNKINLSLMTLRLVMKQMREKCSQTAYRESKLTLFIAPFMHNNGKFLFVFTISANEEKKMQTVDTLEFSKLLGKIKIKGEKHISKV